MAPIGLAILAAARARYFRYSHPSCLILPNHQFFYDTPEAHLHGLIEKSIVPELQKLIVPELNNQIFVITHSYEFINTSPLASLFKVTAYSQGVNQVTSVAYEQDRLQIYDSLGASIAVQLAFSKVIFLEDLQ
jgi:hypothetical protein